MLHGGQQQAMDPPSPSPPRLARDTTVLGSYSGGADPAPVPDARLVVDGITLLLHLWFSQLPLNTYIMLYVSSLEATKRLSIYVKSMRRS